MLTSFLQLFSFTILQQITLRSSSYALVKKTTIMGAMAKFLRRIVRNDAMRTDPEEIYGWRVFALACACESRFLRHCPLSVYTMNG